MNDHLTKTIDNVKNIFEATEEALNNDWNKKGNLKFPELLTFVMMRLKIDAKVAAKIDPFIRIYINDHPTYISIRGAKGGVGLRSSRQDSAAKKAKIEEEKKVLNAQLDAKIALNSDTVSTDISL